MPFRNVARGEPGSAFTMTLDRVDNKLPHNQSNVRAVLRFFNPSDCNQLREALGLEVPEGSCQPFSYSWTVQDVKLFRGLLQDLGKE